MGRLVGPVVGCLVVLGYSVVFSQSPFPQEASGWTAATDAVVRAFDRADVIVLGEGHGRRPDSDFRVALVRNPKFAESVTMHQTFSSRASSAIA